MEPLSLILLTTVAPLVAFTLAILFLMRQPRLAQVVVIGGGTLSLAGAALLLFQGPMAPLRYLWFTSGDMALRFGFLFDGISLMFGVAVALITLCVMVYSLGYMGHDPSKTRYFAMLALFEWAMLSFVYAVDLLQSFIFWELVGLASFFLIGFWYERPSATAAAKKAFLMTRVGDVGLFIGVLLVLQVAGHFDIPGLLAADTGLVAQAQPAVLTMITLLIFVGIVGKSAQFPLHTWLPDAMEGPTPVSALLHSATMVAAGVYLMARLHPLFMGSETTLGVILVIASITALLAATMAMVATDIKKVLAYSSISQLGFMLLGLAAGSLFAGVFHLLTHALFKALLFLCSGLFIHHFESNDLAQIGRSGGRRMPFATAGLLVGGAALAGIPPLGGFFSKEEIFAALGHGGVTIYSIVALLAAFLTAYYTFRMIFLVTRPTHMEETAHDHAHGHGRAEPWSMALPVLLLTVGAAIAGFWGGAIARGLGIDAAHHSLASMAPAVLVVIAGVLLAWMDFGRQAAARTGFIARIPAVEKLFSNGWYVDAFYDAVVVRATMLIATILHAVENKLFDGSFDRLGFSVLGIGAGATRLQNGWVQFYAGWTVILIGVAAAYFGMGG
ncbi:MAG: NADH-quinone oxidoreductase subunit L [bacterium]|nr:NADH-quinone oxidoreductase subunit L [bacterium]